MVKKRNNILTIFKRYIEKKEKLLNACKERLKHTIQYFKNIRLINPHLPIQSLNISRAFALIVNRALCRTIGYMFFRWKGSFLGIWKGSSQVIRSEIFSF